MLRRMTDADVSLLGFDPKTNRPEWMICTVLLVPPPAVRPTVRNDLGQRQEDDLTTKLISIVKYNQQVKTRLEKGQREQADLVYKLLQYEVATLIDNNVQGIQPSQVVRTGRPMRSMTERLKSKEGRIRGNLMGKRVDFSARSVITPDPNISIDELGVPLRIAMNLTFPEVFNRFTRERLLKLVKNGPDVYPGAKFVHKVREGSRTVRLRGIDLDQLAEQLEDGDIVDLHLLDGDFVLFNRQPSLHKMSMMGHRIRVMPHNTFCLNVCVTPNFNADFDGDEMNMHVPQSLTTHEELRQLAWVMNQVISPRECKPIVSVVQDIALGVYRMTLPHVVVSERVVMNLTASLSRTCVPKRSEHSESRGVSGQDLLSAALPPGLFTTAGKVRVADGQIQPGSGSVTKSTYQDASSGLLHAVYSDLGVQAARELLDDTQHLVCDFLVHNGFSVGVSDLIVAQDTLKSFRTQVAEMRQKVAFIISSVHAGTFKNESTRSAGEYFERKVNDILNEANIKIGKLAIADAQGQDNRLVSMITSRSKGQEVNMAQMVGCVGQQNVEGKRIPYGFDGRTLPHYTKFDDGPEARGFVRNSFISGLTP
jgi:DNA-directed RNA polymerase II subunit RPB1